MGRCGPPKVNGHDLSNEIRVVLSKGAEASFMYFFSSSVRLGLVCLFVQRRPKTVRSLTMAFGVRVPAQIIHPSPHPLYTHKHYTSILDAVFDFFGSFLLLAKKKSRRKEKNYEQNKRPRRNVLCTYFVFWS